MIEIRVHVEQQAQALDALRAAGEQGVCVEQFAESLGVRLNTALAIISEIEGPDCLLSIGFDRDARVWRARYGGSEDSQR